ncbi:MAG TPA: glycosyltransferase [Solirubrobacteraceae bacterium]|nr:glycosyltransferase [Solirubrobacteraceae bacterium]
MRGRAAGGARGAGAGTGPDAARGAGAGRQADPPRGGSGPRPAPPDVVIPSVRADAVARLLAALDRSRLGRVIVVWDRPDADPPPLDAEVVRGAGRGPAAARNAGWRAASAEWVAFLDDDVVPPDGWAGRLLADVAAAGPRAGGVAGHVDVPLPRDRRATDWERNVARLATARLVTADFACRRAALEAVGGFDERFPRAYREDTDLELRLLDAGWTIERGSRRVEHPVGEAGWLVSVRMQRGNADDVLLWALHGERARLSWRFKARYAATTLALAAAPALALAGRRRAAALFAAGWAGATAQLAWRRVAPGPRTPREVAAMAATSALVPPAAVAHLARGAVRHRRLVARRLRERMGAGSS